MKIEHKILSKFLDKPVLSTKTTWIEPKNIVSIEVAYLQLLDMHYTKVTTTDSRAYFVFNDACRKALFDYQNQKPQPSFLSKYSENLLTASAVILMFAFTSAISMHSVMEIPQVKHFYYTFLTSEQPPAKNL